MQFHYSSSRAGLVVLSLLVFIVSLASSTPIPSTSIRIGANEPAPSNPLLSKHPFNARIVAPAAQSRVLIGPKYAAHVLASSASKATDPESSVARRSIFSKIGKAFKKIGSGIKHAAQKVGGAIKGAAKKVGKGVKKVAEKVGKGVKKAAEKVGKGVKKAAEKVGKGVKAAAKFIKKEAPVVAKFGLKVLSTAQSVAAKAANFIPGVGKIASKALDAASMGTNAASNAIHAKLPKKLEKGMKVMDKIKNPVSGAAGAALNAVLRRDEELMAREGLEWAEFESREFGYEALEQRDYELEEREYEPLEEREELDEALYARQWNEWEDWE